MRKHSPAGVISINRQTASPTWPTGSLESRTVICALRCCRCSSARWRSAARGEVRAIGESFQAERLRSPFYGRAVQVHDLPCIPVTLKHECTAVTGRVITEVESDHCSVAEFLDKKILRRDRWPVRRRGSRVVRKDRFERFLDGGTTFDARSGAARGWREEGCGVLGEVDNERRDIPSTECREKIVHDRAHIRGLRACRHAEQHGQHQHNETSHYLFLDGLANTSGWHGACSNDAVV